MSIVLSLLRSLLLSTLLSFSTPILVIGGILATLEAASFVPIFTWISQAGATQILGFLTIFGSGYPIQGMLTISITFALVGSLFDLFNFYLYQGSRSQ